MNPGRETLELVRDYDAPPERVFAAWTDVATLGRWFGCADDRLWRIHAWEVRTGGRIHVSLDFDGKPFVVEGEFLVVERPRRLHYRWQGDQRIEVEIEARGTGSRLRLRHDYPAGGGLRPILTAGWSHSLGALGAAAV